MAPQEDIGPPDGQEWLDDDAGPLVRLFGVTRGRTRATEVALDLLTVVITVAVPPPDGRLGPEHGAILRLCQRPVALVEICAALDLPINVLRVLLADLVDRRLVVVRPPNQDALTPSEPLLEELLHGLHRL